MNDDFQLWSVCPQPIVDPDSISGIPKSNRSIALVAFPHEYTFFDGKWKSYHKEWHCVTPPDCDFGWLAETVKRNLPGEYRGWRYLDVETKANHNERAL